MFQWLIVHTVTTAVLAGVVLAASRWFRLSPAARHLLWLVVAVKFLTPPVVYWPWALPIFSPAAAVALPTTTAPAAPLIGAVRTVIIDMPPDYGPEPEVEKLTPPVEERPAAPPFSWDWLPVTAGWTWLAGGVLVALLQAIRILRWRGRLMRGASAPDGLEALVRALAGAMGIRPPRLIVLRSVASPMVWCFGVPRLLWPSGLEDRLSAEGCRAVLLHELAHLRRRDHWVGWLLLTGGCVWWWHPLFWWVRRRLGQEAELACDAYVVGVAPDARRAYAEAILEVSQRMSAAVAVPALGAVGGRRDLERRLIMIMRGPASRRLSWVGLTGAIALGLLALPAWTLGEDKTAPLPTPSVRPVDPMAPVSAVTEAPATTPRSASHAAKPSSTPETPRPSVSIGSDFGGSSRVPAAADGRDQKLQVLEKKVQQLLQEMQQLRGQLPPSGTGDLPMSITNEALIHWDQPDAKALSLSHAPVAFESTTEIITLTRVSYHLKPAKAAALASFLKDNVKTPILEMKDDGEGLIVTTTPEAQHAIGLLIGLMEGKPAKGPTGGTPGPGGPAGPMTPPGGPPNGIKPPPGGNDSIWIDRGGLTSPIIGGASGSPNGTYSGPDGEK